MSNYAALTGYTIAVFHVNYRVLWNTLRNEYIIYTHHDHSAIASGLSIIAYKTPNIYKKLFFHLVIADMLVVVAINFWRAGYKYSGSIVWRYVDEKKLTEARMALEQQNLLPEFSHIYAILASVFILFLYWLAGEAIKNREQEKQKR